MIHQEGSSVSSDDFAITMVRTGKYLLGFALATVVRFFIARSRSLRIMSRKSRAVEAISSSTVAVPEPV